MSSEMNSYAIVVLSKFLKRDVIARVIYRRIKICL